MSGDDFHQRSVKCAKLEEEHEDFFHVTSLSGTSCTFPLSPIRHLRARIGCYMDTCSTHIILLNEKGAHVQDDDSLMNDVEAVRSQFTVRPVNLEVIIQEKEDFGDIFEAAERVVDHLEVKDFRILEWVESNSSYSFKKIKELAWFAASSSRSCAVMEYLLPHIDHINIVDFSGRTALLLSSYNGRDDNVKWLIQSNANIDHPDLWGVSGFCNEGRVQGPIHGCHHNVVSLLLLAKAPINTANRDGDTPLHLAVRCESPHNASMVDSLLNAHAHVDGPDRNGYTPLRTLVRGSEPSSQPVLERLLQVQADVNHLKSNTTILMLMMIQLRKQNMRDYEAIDLLLKANADIYQQVGSDRIHQKGPNDSSALSLAMEWKDKELKNHLLKGSWQYKKLQ